MKISLHENTTTEVHKGHLRDIYERKRARTTDTVKLGYTKICFLKHTHAPIHAHNSHFLPYKTHFFPLKKNSKFTLRLRLRGLDLGRP